VRSAHGGAVADTMIKAGIGGHFQALVSGHGPWGRGDLGSGI